jgi:hypothetical protein
MKEANGHPVQCEHLAATVDRSNTVHGNLGGGNYRNGGIDECLAEIRLPPGMMQTIFDSSTWTKGSSSLLCVEVIDTLKLRFSKKSLQ